MPVISHPTTSFPCLFPHLPLNMFFFPPAPLSIAFQSHSPAFLRLMYLPHFISPDLHAGKFTQTLRFSSQTVPRN